MYNEKTQLSVKLKVLRAEKGLSQRDLAKISKVSLCNISLIESGARKKPTYTVLAKLAVALDVDVGLFLNLLK